MLWVLTVPPIPVAVVIPNNWNVDISSVPPDEVFKVVAVIVPLAVFVPLVFPELKVVYVPPTTVWPPVAASY